MKNFAPIVVFAYNRPDHLKSCVDSLRKNEIASKSNLYVFSDGAKNERDSSKVNEVRKVIESIKGFNKIEYFYEPQNVGLAKSIINGVTKILESYNQIIVLEDDLIVSNDFLTYMNSALDEYRVLKDVFSVSAYKAPINIESAANTFFFQRINSWGWATWKDRWETVDWEVKDFDYFIRSKEERRKFNRGGEDLSVMLLKQKLGVINSWAIRFNYACYRQTKLNLYPGTSKVFNSGTDNSGTHIGATSKYNTEISNSELIFNFEIKEDLQFAKKYRRFFKPSIIRQFINWFKIQAYIRFKLSF